MGDSSKRARDLCYSTTDPGPFANPRRADVVAFALTALAILLSGCFRTPPLPVTFPDDPRVLHGEWQLHVAGFVDGVREFVYAPAAQRLVAWESDEPLVFERDLAGGWHEVVGGLAGPVRFGEFDPSLEAFVAIEFGRATPRIRVTPVDGGPIGSSEVALPTGHTLVAVARGSGRSFALTRAADGRQHLSWWDSVSGTHGGTRTVSSAPDGMRVSSNGRILSLWNMWAWEATLVDTAAPQTSLRLPLGACRSNGTGEASADGRWFLFMDCWGNMRLADLTAPEPSSFAIGAKREGWATFVADGTNVLWLDSGGVVNTFDPASRTRSELTRLAGDELYDVDPWRQPVYAHHGADLLAVVTGRGTIRASTLTGAGTAELPEPRLAGATIDLAAAALADGATHGYDFSGAFTPAGSTERLRLTGWVSAYDFHDYRPAGPAVRPAAYVPRLYGRATVVDPESDGTRFELEFMATQRSATAFEGRLTDVTLGAYYRVVLERAGEPAPVTAGGR